MGRGHRKSWMSGREGEVAQLKSSLLDWIWLGAGACALELPAISWLEENKLNEIYITMLHHMSYTCLVFVAIEIVAALATCLCDKVLTLHQMSC